MNAVTVLIDTFFVRLGNQPYISFHDEFSPIGTGFHSDIEYISIDEEVSRSYSALYVPFLNLWYTNDAQTGQPTHRSANENVRGQETFRVNQLQESRAVQHR